MLRSAKTSLACLLVSVLSAYGQRECYYAKGKVGPSNLVPCLDEGDSACCLLGDKCFSGGICGAVDSANEDGILYQYGCTDSTFESEGCPFKCGWDDTLSPWASVQYCNDISDTWICQSPESCGCEWEQPYNLTNKGSYNQYRTCKGMNPGARVALLAPPNLAPYVLLPKTPGGNTGYFSPAPGTDGLTRWYTTSGVPSNVTQYVPAYPTASPTNIVLAEASITLDTSTTSTAIRASTADSSKASLPASSSSSLPSSTSSLPSSSSSSSPSSPSSSTGLSTGAKAGIGGAIGGVVCAIVIIAYLLWRLRKQRQLNKPAQMAQTQHYPPDPPLPGQTPAYQAPHSPSIPGSPYGYSPVQSPYTAYSPDASAVPPQYRHSQPYPLHWADAKAPAASPPSELPATRGVYELSTGGGRK